jgi:hypothetical protein
MDPAVSRNAFRILGLAADAEPKEIYRQQQRLEIALDMGERPQLFPFVRPIEITREAILDAVHRLEHPSTRLREELFWFHSFSGKFDVNGESLDDVTTLLGAESSKTTRGAVALHNRAVLLTLRALSSPAAADPDQWNEAIMCWAELQKSSIFWQFLEDRFKADVVEAEDSNSRIECSRIVARAVEETMWSAIRGRDCRVLSSLIKVVLEHQWLPTDLEGIASKIRQDGQEKISAALARVAALEETNVKASINKVLFSAEREVLGIGEEVGALLRAFPPACRAVWNDAVATALDRLSIATYNLADDEEGALRLVTNARKRARTLQLQQVLEEHWRFLQRSILCSEAVKLMDLRQFSSAEAKLAAALNLAEDEHRQQITELQEACARAKVLEGVDKSQVSPSLFTFNGIGATFYGRRDYDRNRETYVTTHWFVILFFPIFPLGAYRVRDSGSGSYQIFGRVPLSNLAKKYRLVSAAALVLLVLWANVDAGRSSCSRDARGGSRPAVSPGGSAGPGVEWPSTTPPSAQSGYGPRTRAQEATAIELERGELVRLKRELDAREQQINSEEKELAELESYIERVQNVYTADRIPDNVYQQYQSALDDFNRRAPVLNQAISSFNSEVGEYERKRAAFNARVQRYNNSR